MKLDNGTTVFIVISVCLILINAGLLIYNLITREYDNVILNVWGVVIMGWSLYEIISRFGGGWIA